MTVAGEFAFVSSDPNGVLIQGYLMKGTRLVFGKTETELAEAQTVLSVDSVSGRTYHLSEPIPTGMAERGAYLLASGPPGTFKNPDGASPVTGFEIESATDRAITVRDYPAVACDRITLLHSRWVMSEK